MKKIRCLIFDNDASDIRRFKTAIATHWKKIQDDDQNVPGIEFNEVDDYDAALAIIESNPKCDVFLCDVYVPRGGKEEPIGIHLMQNAMRPERLFPAIIALTMGPLGDMSNYHAEMNDCCDFVISKERLGGKDGPAETQRIVDILRREGVLTYSGRVMRGKPNDPALEALFEKVGESTLSAIASHFSPDREADVVHISVLASGLSGADVLMAQYGKDGGDLSPMSVLLKISRDGPKLQQEFKNYREYVARKKVLKNVMVNAITERDVLQVKEWSVLGMDFLDNSETLLSLVKNPEAKVSDVERLLSELCSDGGLEVTQKSTRKEKPSNPLTALCAVMLTPYRVAAIRAAAKELSPLIGRYLPDRPRMVEKFIKLSSESLISEECRAKLPNQMLYTLQHGDLHAKNVMVYGHGQQVRRRLLVIDYANIALLPWPLDIVRLLVDVTISGIDADHEGYEWSNLSSWLGLTDFLLAGEKSGLPRRVAGQAIPLTAIETLRANIFSMSHQADKESTRVEFAIAVAIELLRASYRVIELPAPKRAFALVAAAMVLEVVDKKLAAL